MIYIHIPFCRSFCTYCGFYSEICSGSDAQRVQNFVDALCSEIRERRGEPGFASAPHTLYIGGGTPSVLPPAALETIVSAVWHSAGPLSCQEPASGQCWEEFTVEVNPDDVTPEYAAFLKSLGVTRVSMGVQSFDDGVLRWMNRRHTSVQAVSAFRFLREAGFDNISIDLIFGISQLTEELWALTVRQALALRPEHISAYQLSVEEDSVLADMASDGRYTEASDDQCRAQYDYLCRALADAGYHHYEVSNFSLPGREAVHNSAYWARVPYVGFGPGAHSFDGTRRSWNSQYLCDWTSGGETLSAEDARLEVIMLGLRRAEGLPESVLRPLTDPATLDRLLSEGLLELSSEHIRIPERHFFISDHIIESL